MKKLLNKRIKLYENPKQHFYIYVMKSMKSLSPFSEI